MTQVKFELQMLIPTNVDLGSVLSTFKAYIFEYLGKHHY